MSNIRILVIGSEERILHTVVRLINKNKAWQGTGAINESDAIEKFKKDKFDIVMFGGGIEENVENNLRSLLKALNSKIIFICHYGGGSGLLSNEIQQALDNNKDTAFSRD